MLVLTRRIGEEIVIAGHIRLKVVAARGQTVRIGITAPDSLDVFRSELLPGCRRDQSHPQDKPATRRRDGEPPISGSITNATGPGAEMLDKPAGGAMVE
jgi:carbon storage regulator